jgi:hypothetical protein
VSAAATSIAVNAANGVRRLMTLRKQSVMNGSGINSCASRRAQKREGYGGVVSGSRNQLDQCV